jgi:hypothetical protein
MSTQPNYDKDCNIIKETVTKEEFEIVINEFRNQIELLKEHNINLQKDIELLKNQSKDYNWLIKPYNSNTDDKYFEEINNDLVKYLDSLTYSEDFINIGYKAIEQQTFINSLSFSPDFIKLKSEEYKMELSIKQLMEVAIDKCNMSYLKRRNLCIIKENIQHDDKKFPKYYLAKYNIYYPDRIYIRYHKIL